MKKNGAVFIILLFIFNSTLLPNNLLAEEENSVEDNELTETISVKDEVDDQKITTIEENDTKKTDSISDDDYQEDIEIINSIEIENNVQDNNKSKNIILEGSCGENATFVVYEDGSMIIDGYGEMDNYEPFCYVYSNQDPCTIIPTPWDYIGDSIVSVEINGVSSIGDYAFYGCGSLKEIIIHDSVTNIGKCAFHLCRRLFHIFIPKSVVGFDGWPFDNKYTKHIFTDLPLDDSLWNEYNQHPSFNFYNVTKEEYYQTINYDLFILETGLCGADVTYKIYSDFSMVISGNGNMSDFDYYGERPWEKFCGLIKSVTVENGVTNIGAYAFYDEYSITSLSLGNTVERIEARAFWSCDSLKSFTIPNSVTYIGRGTFASCDSLTTIAIPSSITYIGSSAFTGKSITSIIVSNNNPVYDSRDNCNAIIEKTSNTLVQGCRNTVIPNSVTLLGDSSFSGASMTSIIVPDSIEVIGSSVFSGCSSLTSVNLPETLISIGSFAFSGCSSLTNIEIPDSVTSIGEYAFYNTNIDKIYVPMSVIEIGNTAFYNIKDIYTGASSKMSSWDEEWHTSSWYTENGENIIASVYYNVSRNDYETLKEDQTLLGIGKCGDNLTYKIYDNYSMVISGTGAMYDYTYNYFDIGNIGINKVIIEEGVTHVGICAFEGWASLNTVIIPNTVTTIGGKAFCECKNLSSINIPNSVTHIGPSAFVYCAFSSLTIPDSMTTISEDCFSFCENLETVIIPNSVRKIDSYAFKSCINIESIILPDSINFIGNNAFEDCTSLSTILIPDSVKHIGSNAFSSCYNLCSVKLPETLVAINNGAFSSCYNLTSINIPDSVTYIGKDAFCASGLTSINIPDSVESIDEFAFYECMDLVIDVIPETISFIGIDAFSYIGSETIFVPKTVVEIGMYAFAHIDDIYTDAPSDMPLWASDVYDPWYGSDSSTVVHYNTTLEEYYELINYQYGSIKNKDIDTYEEMGRPEGLWVSQLRYNSVPIQGVEYTGKPLTLSFNVYHGNRLLIENTDYTVKYTNNTKVGTATITVTGKGNYAGSSSKQFNIYPTTIDENNTLVTLNKDAFVFNKNKQKPTISSVICNGVKLNNSDYTVEYENADSSQVGFYGIHILGKGNYQGDLYVSYLISDSIKPLSSLSISGIKNVAYTGKKMEQDIIVKDGKNVLVNGEHYHVEYIDNTNAGTAYAIIVGNGYYAGSVTKTFKITPVALSNKNVAISGLPTSVDYSGVVKPKTVLEYGNVILVEGKDYTVTYKNNDKAGKATITYKGIGNYSGTINASFTINKIDIEYYDISMNDTYIFTKGGVKPEPTIIVNKKILELNKDYTLSYKNNNEISYYSSVNRPTITIKGKGNYKGTITRTFDITSKDIADVTMTVPDKAYTGKVNSWKSVPVLTDVNGNKLAPGSDYNNKFTYYTIDGITYVAGSDCYNDYLYAYEEDTYVYDGSQKTKPLVYRRAGSVVKKTDIPLEGTIIRVHAAAAVTYKNIKTIYGYTQRVAIRNYAGSTSATYKIVKADISKATVSIPVQQYTGKPITLDKSDITVKVNNQILQNSDYEIISYSNNIASGKSTVTIRGIGNYGGTKTVNFTIAKKQFSLFGLLGLD